MAGAGAREDSSCGTHNGDEDVQAWGEGAAVLPKPLHHVGCTGGEGKGWGRERRALHGPWGRQQQKASGQATPTAEPDPS